MGRASEDDEAEGQAAAGTETETALESDMVNCPGGDPAARSRFPNLLAGWGIL